MEEYLPVFIILFATFAAVGYIIYRNVVNPICIFCGLFTVVLILYDLHLYDLYRASDTVLTIIVLGVFSFFGGAIFRSFLTRYHKRRTDLYEVLPNYTLMISFNAVSIIMLFGVGIATIQMLLSGITYSHIHLVYASEEGTVGSSVILSQFWEWYIWPWILTSIPLSIIILFTGGMNKAKGKIFVVTSFINVGLYILISGTRSALVQYIAYMVIVLMFRGKKLRLSRNKKILMVVIVMVAWIIFNRLSESRNGVSLLKTLYIYICGCVPYLNVRLQRFGSGMRGYGLYSFYGIYRVFLPVITRVFGRSELFDVVQMNTSTQGRAYIGPSMTFNAFVTPFYFFYIDAGLLGVAVLSFSYGFLSIYVYEKVEKDPSTKNMLFYLLIAYGLFYSMIRFHFVSLRYFLAFVYASISYHQFKIRRFGRMK